MEQQPKNHRPPAQALTPKAKLFVREYLKDFNATQAAIRAGYSPATARAQGSRMLTNVNIAGAVQHCLEKLYKSTEVTVANTVRNLNRIASFDPASVFDAQGRLLPIHRMPTAARLGLTGLHVSETTAGSADKGSVVTRAVRFDGKLAAIVALTKHLAMFDRRIARDPSDPAIRDVDRSLYGYDDDDDNDLDEEELADDAEGPDDSVDEHNDADDSSESGDDPEPGGTPSDTESE